MEFVSFVREQKWNIIGPAVGITIAETLGRTIDPSLAWLVGGSIWGGIGAIFGSRKNSGLFIIGGALATGLGPGGLPTGGGLCHHGCGQALGTPGS